MITFTNKYRFLLIVLSLLTLGLLMAWPLVTPALATATEWVAVNDSSNLTKIPGSFSGAPFSFANSYANDMGFTDGDELIANSIFWFLNGYAWEAGQSKQVVYNTFPDGHIHELYVTIDGTWQQADLTALTGAVPSQLIVSSYGWETGQSKQVVYVGHSAHLFELSVTVGGAWQYADLNELTGAPSASGFAVGYAWEAGQSKQVVYTSSDHHIHELSVSVGGTWQHADLTALTGAPLGLVVDGYGWEAGHSKQVVYITADGHIHELRGNMGGRWRHADLTELTGAPPSRTVGGGYAWEAGQSKQVVYQTDDGHIHELWMIVGGTWQHADLTALTEAPPVTGFLRNGYAWEAFPSKQVIYTTNDGHIHELYVTLAGIWQHADLTELTGAPLESGVSFPVGYAWESFPSKQVVYQGRDGHIHELYVTLEGIWRHADLTALIP